MSSLIDTNQMYTGYLRNTDPHIGTISAGSNISTSLDGTSSSLEVVAPDADDPLFLTEYFTVATDPLLDGSEPAGVVWETTKIASFPTGLSGTYEQFIYKKYGTSANYYLPSVFYKTRTRRLQLTLITEDDASSAAYKIGAAFRGSIGVPSNPYLIYTDTLTPTVRSDGWYEFKIVYDMNETVTEGILYNIFIRQPSTKTAFKITDLKILEDL